MNGGTYAEGVKVFGLNDKKSVFFGNLGFHIKNYVADIIVNNEYPEYKIGEYNLKNLKDDAESAGFTINEIEFLQRFTNETITEAIDTCKSKMNTFEKKLTFKYKVAQYLKDVAKHLEK
jgi:hypothetical protein